MLENFSRHRNFRKIFKRHKRMIINKIGGKLKLERINYKEKQRFTKFFSLTSVLIKVCSEKNIE